MNSIILVLLVIFLHYPKPAHHLALDNHGEQHTEEYPVSESFPISPEVQVRHKNEGSGP